MFKGKNESMIDEEKATTQSRDYEPQSRINFERSVRDDLADFRFLVGITTNPSLRTAPYLEKLKQTGKRTDELDDIDREIQKTGREGRNFGLYSYVCQNSDANRRRYRVYKIVTITALLLQIIIAAILTALGASQADYIIIALFGAINTVLAGFITFVEGSGIPNRFRYYWSEWTKLRDYIEQREREYMRGEQVLTPREDVVIIERMFRDVKEDIEANIPHNFVSVRDLQKKGGTHEVENLPRPAPVATQTSGVHGISNLTERLPQSLKDGTGLGATFKGIESQARETLDRKIENLQVEAKDKLSQAAEAVGPSHERPPQIS